MEDTATKVKVTQKKRVSLYIDPKLHERIKADAIKKDRSINWVVEKALKSTYPQSAAA